MGRRERLMGLMNADFPFTVLRRERTRTIQMWESLMILKEVACLKQEDETKEEILLLHCPCPNTQEEETKEELLLLHRPSANPNTQEEETKKEEEPVRKKMKMMENVSIHGEEEEEQNHHPNNTTATQDNNEPGPAPHSWLVAHHRMMVSTRDRGLIHVCEKRLTKSDVDSSQNRLLLPTETVRNILIPGLGYALKDEKGVLKAEGIQVVGLDPAGRPWNLCWKFWGKYHVLIGQWMKLVKLNGFEANVHKVHVSAFRYGEGNRNICFVIDTPSGSASASASASASLPEEQPIQGFKEESEELN